MEEGLEMNDVLFASEIPYISFSLDNGPTVPIAATLVGVLALRYFAKDAENRRALALAAASLAFILLFTCFCPAFFKTEVAAIASLGYYAMGLAPLVGSLAGVRFGWFFVTGGATLMFASMLLYGINLAELRQLESDTFDILRMVGATMQPPPRLLAV